MPESGKAGRRRRMHWSARHPRPAPQLPRCERRAKRRTCGTSWKRRASVTQGLHRVTHSALGASLNEDLHVVLAVEPPDDKHERSHSPHLPPVGEDQLHTCPPLALTCGHGACAKTRTRRVLRRGPKKRGWRAPCGSASAGQYEQEQESLDGDDLSNLVRAAHRGAGSCQSGPSSPCRTVCSAGVTVTWKSCRAMRSGPRGGSPAPVPAPPPPARGRPGPVCRSAVRRSPW